MKNSLILLPLLLILAILIFSILMSQAISKETENTIIRKQREKRITGQTGKSNVVVRVYILMFQFW